MSSGRRSGGRRLALALALAALSACTSQGGAAAPPEDAAGGLAAPTPSAPDEELGEDTDSEAAAAGEQEVSPPPYTPRPEDLVEPRQPIEDPSGEALAHFYDALARTDAGAPELTRVAHFGDSSIGLDGLPHAIRKRMQARFGDGGAGFVLIHEYSRNVSSRVVKRRAGEGWNTCYIAYDCKKDGEYGYGGHVFQGGRGAVSEIATLDRGDLSTSASRLELWYAAWPRGGRASLQVDGAAPVVLETRADALEDRWHEIDLDAGPHKVTLRGEGQGTLRAYGLVLEEDGPGVVWDTMSMIGAFTRRLFLFSPNHIARQVAHRDPHLIVFNYGGNDLRRFVSRGVSPERFKEEMRVAYQKIRAGKPEASCLVVSVIDHGRSGIRTVEARHVDAVVDAQR
ncbi:MAG: hypothetical protein KC636_25310, partial [Myxococcales bacterium]|nr:hypothetical protein [Myxococcales bacterium]